MPFYIFAPQLLCLMQMCSFRTRIETASTPLYLSLSLCKVCLLLRMLISTLHDNLLLPSLPACIFLLFFSLILWHVKLNAPQPGVVGRNSATFYNNHKRRDCLCLCLSVGLSVYLTCILLHLPLVITILGICTESIVSRLQRAKGRQPWLIPIWLSLLFLPVIFHFYPKEKNALKHERAKNARKNKSK